jgi:soluble lytic murein transglycosylase-like protein
MFPFPYTDAHAEKIAAFWLQQEGRIWIIGEMKIARIVILLFMCRASPDARADCFDDASAYHQVNPWILRAIAFQESKFRPSTIIHNKNRSVDRGLMGINSIHDESLAKFGIGPDDLMDGCKSVYIGAWAYRKKIKRHGNTCKAIGAYHSETPEYRDKYVVAIRGVLAGWGIPLNC